MVCYCYRLSAFSFLHCFPLTKSEEVLTTEELRKIHAYWRACNYLAIGMIYLRDNPLLREPLKPEHIKKRLLGHWGSSPALNFTRNCLDFGFSLELIASTLLFLPSLQWKIHHHSLYP